MSDDPTILSFPARIVQRAAITAGRRDELIALARKRAYDPSIFDDAEPFLFPAEISNSGLDSYSTTMDTSSLRNYAGDAEAGVALLNAHNQRDTPVGYSLAGGYVGGQGNGVERVTADFYITPGLQVIRSDGFGGGAPNASTDDFIRLVRAGQLRDVSIGFYGGTMECSLCGKEMLRGWWDWGGANSCYHVPGVKYTKRDPGTGDWVKGEFEVAVGIIKDARLSEVSLVADGATPGAIVGKARAVAAAGKLLPEQARFLEQRFHQRIAGADHNWPGFRAEGGRPGPSEHRDHTPPDAGAEKEQEDTRMSNPTTVAAPEQNDRSAEIEAQQRRIEEMEKRFAALEADRDSLRQTAESQAKELADSKQRVTDLTTAARRKRFAEIVAGRGEGGNGAPWYGDAEKNLRRLEQFADVYGEDSDDFRELVQRERAMAEQTSKSDLFREVGTGAPASGGNAVDDLTRQARELADKEGIALGDAMARVASLPANQQKAAEARAQGAVRGQNRFAVA